MKRYSLNLWTLHWFPKYLPVLLQHYPLPLYLILCWFFWWNAFFLAGSPLYPIVVIRLLRFLNYFSSIFLPLPPNSFLNFLFLSKIHLFYTLLVPVPRLANKSDLCLPLAKICNDLSRKQLFFIFSKEIFSKLNQKLSQQHARRAMKIYHLVNKYCNPDTKPLQVRLFTFAPHSNYYLEVQLIFGPS